MVVARVPAELTPDDVLEVLAEAQRRRTYQAGRERFRERLADRLVTPGALHDAVAPSFAGLAREPETGDAALSAGVNLVGLGAIKGLEFETAIVVEPRAILDAHTDGGRGGLYTAVTRSTRALAIVHSAPLPAGLADCPDLTPIGDVGAADAWAAGLQSGLG